MREYVIKADGERITVKAESIFDAFRKVRALRPKAIVVSDTRN